MSDLQIFDVSGSDMRFGVSEDGRPYVVAEDLAPQVGYSRARNALRMVDEDEKGAQIVSTPGGNQRMDVLYEDGIWELIFRSRKPEARAIKKRVKAILKQIRETGSYTVEPRTIYQLPQTYSAALRELADKSEALEVAQPKADAWDELAEAAGDYSVREASQILSRDHGIATGQNRLFATLRDIEWVDDTGQPYQNQVDLERIRRRTTSYTHPHTKEPVLSSQVRITVKGIEALRKHLGGGNGQLSLVPAGGA
jgi:prophage antirepressor-like protein